MKLFGSLKELVSVVFRKNGKEVTLEVGTQAGTATSRVFTLPDIDSDSPVAHELLTENAVQNVTNKTIDADSNTITNIENADIKVGAAIDAAKIGSGTVSNTEFGYLDGVSSAIQTQINGKQATITGAATTITSSDLTASKALQSDASGKVAASSVTSTELGYVSGVTSAIQTQINSKQATITGAASTIVSSDLSVSKALQSDASGKVSASSVTSTELGYVSGVTSAIQTQLGNKAAKGANSDITSLSGLTTALSIGQGGTGQTTANTALNALLPSQASAANKYLKSDGTNTSWASASGGAGELNAILNASGADGTTGWTNVSVVSGASSPLNPVITTAFSISNAATTESSTSGGYYPFTMPSGMLNRKLKVEFTYTTPATDVYKVSVYKGSTRVALSTDVSSSTSLPASVTGGKFVAYFDTDSSTSWTLSVTRTSGSTGACVVTNVIVGPGIQPQGAVVGEWVSYTPTGPWSTNTTYTGRYRRVGDSIELVVDLALSGAPTSANLIFTEAQILNGLNLTVDSTKFPITTDFAAPVGTWSALDSGVSGNYGGHVTWNGSQLFAAYPTGINTAQIINATTPIIFGSADNVSLRAILPISQWAGSGTVQLAQNDVEYASNSSSTDADNTASFAYGPAGSAGVLGTTSLTAQRAKRVRFQTPIQSTDILTVEIQFGSGAWLPVNQHEYGNFSYVVQNTVTYGVYLVPVSGSTTDVDVAFTRYSRPTGATYGAAGENWSAVTNAKWRVRKSSAGAAVGFGIVQPGTSAGLVSASGLPGNTTGNAIAAGYVGEKLETTSSETSATPGSFFANDGKLLTKGVWLVIARANTTASGTLTSNKAFRLGISTATGSITGNAVNIHLNDVAYGFGAEVLQYLNLAADTTYYAVGLINGGTGTCTMDMTIQAIRIA